MSHANGEEAVFLFQSCKEANLLQSVNKPITNYLGFPLLLSCCMQVQERDPRSYQIYLQLPDGTCFLGSTPEQLYIRSGSHVASEAVAATRPRGPAGRPASEAVTPACLCMSKMYFTSAQITRSWRCICSPQATQTAVESSTEDEMHCSVYYNAYLDFENGCCCKLEQLCVCR